jgi:hypothetical protein
MRNSPKDFSTKRSNNHGMAEASRASLCSDSRGRASGNPVSSTESSAVGRGTREGSTRPGVSVDADRALPTNSESTKSEILELFSTLSSEEASDLLPELVVLAKAKSPKVKDRKLVEHRWYSVVSEGLLSQGVASPPLVVVGKSAFASSYRKGVAVCEDYISGMGAEGRVDREKARRLLFRTLLTWMRNCQVPVSFKATAQNLANAPTAMEWAFPRYRVSGLLSVLLRQSL